MGDEGHRRGRLLELGLRDGLQELVAALDAHRASLDVPARRLRARRRAALASFTAEHGERALRALGGRRAAERWLDAQEPGLDVLALERPARGAGLMLRTTAILFAVFAGATLIAELLGAANLGTAATFGQLAFLATLVYLLVRG